MLTFAPSLQNLKKKKNSGFLTGALFRSPRGLRTAAVAGVLGAAAAGALAAARAHINPNL
jgi:hypothetical protein